MSNYELFCVKGGATGLSISSLSIIARVVNTLVKLGQTIGSNIRRIVSGSVC